MEARTQSAPSQLREIVVSLIWSEFMEVTGAIIDDEGRYLSSRERCTGQSRSAHCRIVEQDLCPVQRRVVKALSQQQTVIPDVGGVPREHLPDLLVHSTLLQEYVADPGPEVGRHEVHSPEAGDVLGTGDG